MACSDDKGFGFITPEDGSDECPGQYPRNLVALLHLYFPTINRTKLTNQLLCRLHIVGF